MKEVRRDHGWGLDGGMFFGLLFGLWCSLGAILSQKNSFSFHFQHNHHYVSALVRGLLMGPSLPAHTEESTRAAGYSPPCHVSLGSPRRINPSHVLSSAPAQSLASDPWHNRLPWSLHKRGHLENCHQSNFLGGMASSTPSFVPHTHFHLLIPWECCQTSLGSSVCGAWLAVSGSVSAGWDLGSGEADGSGTGAEAVPAMSL